MFHIRIVAVDMGAFLGVREVFEDEEAFSNDVKIDFVDSMRMINKSKSGLIISYPDRSDGVYFTGSMGLAF